MTFREEHTSTKEYVRISKSFLIGPHFLRVLLHLAETPWWVRIRGLPCMPSKKRIRKTLESWNLSPNPPLGNILAAAARLRPKKQIDLPKDNEMYWERESRQDSLRWLYVSRWQSCHRRVERLRIDLVCPGRRDSSASLGLRHWSRSVWKISLHKPSEILSEHQIVTLVW